MSQGVTERKKELSWHQVIKSQNETVEINPPYTVPPLTLSMLCPAEFGKRYIHIYKVCSGWEGEGAWGARYGLKNSHD